MANNGTVLDALFSYSGRIFIKNNHPNNTPENLARLRFLAVSSYFGIIFILSLLIGINIPNGDTVLILSDIALLIMIFSLIMVARYKGTYQAVFTVTVAMLAIILPFGYFSDTAERALFLVPVVLLYAYFLLGRRGGLFWTAVIYAINGVAILVDMYGYATLSMSYSYILNSSIALFFISLMLYAFENNNALNQRLIRQQAWQLQKANRTLQDELQSRVELTQQLQKTVQDTEKNNRILEESKRALLNVLEDSNELQQQLTQEKADVEQKIELRTRQLEEEQARLHASIDTLDLGFLMTLRNGTSILHNPALLSICGLPEDGHGEKLLDSLHTQIKKSFKLKAAVKQCQDTGEAFTISDLQINGKYIRILGSAIKITEDAESIGVVLLVEDMSESKMLDRSKDEFVSIASHELRTPLTAIRGNLSLIQLLHGDKFKDKELNQMMDDITDSVIRLISIVNQFLTTSRLEQKKTVFALAPVDTAKVINSAVSDLQSMANESKLDLIVAVPKDLPAVKADEGRLQGVLNNLIGNAIKYTDKGTITITAEHTGAKVIVRIIDTGKGIDTKNQHLLFQKFQQASDNILTRDDSRSTGLGLYITKLMVEQMGGTISLEKSTPGKGSTFSFAFPVA